ncbi:MAG TPA: FHA domain-containing protein [Gemmataceae bacterium]|nr:FHA domain-containing protein [Gemmataceae bacterium]
MRARLVSADGGPSFEIVKDMTLIGRDEECDIRLDHKSVSKLQCVVVKTDGLLLIRDLGSTNGTRVNGQRVRRAALLPGDNLTVANLKYVVKFGAALDAEPPPPDPRDAATPSATARRNALPDVYPETDAPSSS